VLFFIVAATIFSLFLLRVAISCRLSMRHACCCLISYMPTTFGFADQRFRRWMASGRSPVFIPTASSFFGYAVFYSDCVELFWLRRFLFRLRRAFLATPVFIPTASSFFGYAIFLSSIIFWNFIPVSYAI